MNDPIIIDQPGSQEQTLAETVTHLAAMLLIFADRARDEGDDFYSAEMRMVSKLMTSALAEYEDAKPF